MDGKFLAKLFRRNFSLLFLTLLQPPPKSTRPPVIGYNISYNATGTLEANVTYNTKFVIRMIPPEVILFTVNALNILGNGRESSVIGELILIFYLC